MSANVVHLPVYGASPADWAHLGVMLGLTADLLPVVSNPNATISPDSGVTALGKVPTRYNSRHHVTGLAKWTERITDQADIERWSHQPDYGICIQTREVRAIDIDVDDATISADIVDFVTDHLGMALPIRRRANSGKCLLAVRVAGEYVKRTVKVAGGVIENLNNGQQFIAVGTHPSGFRYEWEGGLPDDFPTLTHEQYENLWRALVQRFGTANATESTASVRKEKLYHAHQSDPVAQLLFERGYVRSTHTDGRLFLRCPFEHEHTTVGDDRDTSTAYWPAYTGGYVNGHFHCLHAHCEGRGDYDFLEALGFMPELEDFDALLDEGATPAASPDEMKKFNLVERTAARLFQGEPPPTQWLVQGIFPLGKVAVLASPPGVGKSFLALDLACKIAGGHSSDSPASAFGGVVGTSGRVVYVSAEDDEPEIHRRLYSLTGAGLAMPDRLYVLSLPDVGHFGVVEVHPRTRSVRPTAGWRALVDEIKGLTDVRLVVLDTMQAMAGGDLNDSVDAQPLMDECIALSSATGATVLLLHHVTKGKTKEIRTALDAAEAIRGSGAIVGSARTSYVLWTPADGGVKICDALNIPFTEGAVALGIVAKTNGDARRDRAVFLRQPGGLLIDVTARYKAAVGENPDALHTELVRQIKKAWDNGAAFAATHSRNGLYDRRYELPEGFHEKPRRWFEEAAGALLSAGRIRRHTYKNGGHQLAPIDDPDKDEVL